MKIKALPIDIFFSAISTFIIFINLNRLNEYEDVVENETFIIAFNFLKFCNYDLVEIQNKLEKLFSSYSKKRVLNLIRTCNFQKKEIYASCRNLSTQEAKNRYYVLYSLMDLASDDGLYSLKEEEYIEKVRQLLKVPLNSFLYIKNAYLKRGLAEERIILEEQARKSYEEDFIPFNAYKILGVTPNITVVRLKEVYRKLAKQFHPDKYIGQNEDSIHQAEEKFKEITLAYKIVLNRIKP
jgi:DnaJ-domain-containing protein 1